MRRWFGDSDAQRSRKAERERALSTPGVAIPGTGKWNYHRRYRKLKPYRRPRSGGGYSVRIGTPGRDLADKRVQEVNPHEQ